MPTWKKRDKAGTIHFQFLCTNCSRKKLPLLKVDEWILVRDGEPASCNDCTLSCTLTLQGLWGSEDGVRYKVCEECAEYETCDLKGRYYC